MAMKAPNSTGTSWSSWVRGLMRLIINNRSTALVLDDHVMHDNASTRRLPHLRCRPGKIKVPNSRKASLDHTKCMIDIPPAILCARRKPSFLLSVRVWDSLHKCRRRRVNVIKMKESFGVCMVIDFIVDRKSMSVNKVYQTPESATTHWYYYETQRS
jgi:hypothetical protein